MSRRFIVIAAAAFLIGMCAMTAFAADDPFTGTWRVIPSKSVMANLGRLVLAPASGGISIQQGDSKPDIAYYGKDSQFAGGMVWNIVRVDDHNLKSTASQDGQIVINETATVSADGMHYTRIQERTEAGRKTTMEYDRVGSVPVGDAFVGTWQLNGPFAKGTMALPNYILKVDDESFDWSIGDSHRLTARFDGKEYRDDATFGASKVRRIDSHTIEIVTKITAPKLPNRVAAKGSDDLEMKMLWQVNGDTLTLTPVETEGDQSTGIQSRSPMFEFERVK